jgi:NAD(P)-dependent dehydrogenase (short-subunit alcohol dehydrogenase family)
MQLRVALVTGAARGQGLAIVRRLRRDGVAVAAGDVLVDELRHAVDELADSDVLALELDVVDEGSWGSALEQIRRQFGGLNVLVNNAGILHRTKLMEETAADFERLWRVNCLGPFLGMRAAAKMLAEADQPAIVNTLSTAAVQPFAKHASYTSSKWAARGLTLTAALEFAELGIRVNSVLPGPVATPMHDLPTIERLASAPLLGRIGIPEDIAEVVAFLASPASSFLTGSEILADGGQVLRSAQGVAPA